MKKIVWTAAALAAAALSGCADNDKIGYDIEAKALLPKSGMQEIVLTENATEITYDVWIYRSGYNEGGTTTASLFVDADALAAYNKENGTAYELMPQSDYTLPETLVRLTNDDYAAKVTVTLDVSAIAAGSPYVLPISVRSADTPVSPSSATTLLRPVRPEPEEPK